jgi:FkbM family methyltransferase
MKSSIVKKLFSWCLGKKRFQKMFERLHSLSLMGMNIGTVADPEKSGELAAIKYIKEKLQNSGELVLFDVGANIGNYGRLLFDIFTSQSKIYCFEPSPSSFNILKSNLGGLENVQLFNLGFGEQGGTLTLYSDSTASSMASLYKRRLDHYNIRFNHLEAIELRTIDEFCEENNIRQINFLKLDVEGYEYNVLKGAENIINKNLVDYIQFEFGGTQIDSRIFFQDFYYLLLDRYNFYRVVKDGLYKIDGYKERYEIFMASIYIAERKGI